MEAAAATCRGKVAVATAAAAMVVVVAVVTSLHSDDGIGFGPTAADTVGGGGKARE